MTAIIAKAPPSVFEIASHHFTYFDLTSTFDTEILELKTTVDKTLDVWIKIYSDIPEGITYGEYVSSIIKDNMSYGKLAFLKDCHNVIQGIAQLCENEGVLRVKNLVVSPWSCSQVRTFLKYEALKTEESYGVIDLAKHYNTGIDDVLRQKKGSGTLLMLALCIYAKTHAFFKIELLSLKNSSGFYEKIGGDKVIDSKNIFIFDLTSSLPEKILLRSTELSLLKF